MVQRLLQTISLVTISLGVRVVIGAAIAVNCFVTVPNGELSRQPVSPSVEKTHARDQKVKGKPPAGQPVPASALLIDFPEAAKLADPSPAAASQFGFSVAIDGDTAIVGSPGDANNKGAAAIYTRNGSSWVLQQKITGNDGLADDNFGWSVAISGETAIVGAFDLNEADQGAAYIFVRNGSTWSQGQKLTASGGSITDQFGISVSIDGDTAVIGASGDQSSRGAGYVFSRNGTAWTQQQKLTASDAAAGDDFGWSVDVNAETAVIGAPGDDGFRGSAYVFIRNGTVWSQQAKAAASDGMALDRFGYSVAVDGDYMLAGAPLTNNNGKLSGSEYAFVRSGSNWQQQQELIASDGEVNDKFGGAVDLKGSTAVIGANGDDVGNAVDKGSAYVFSRDSNTWTQTQKLQGSDSVIGDNFGGSVAIRAGAILVGSYLDDSGSLLDAGSAFIFAFQTTPTPTPTPVFMANISGRVFTSSGNGLRNAKVTITDAVQQTFENTSTSTLGYFQFTVVSGRDYVIGVNSKRYRFSTLALSVNGDVSGLEFIGLE